MTTTEIKPAVRNQSPAEPAKPPKHTWYQLAAAEVNTLLLTQAQTAASISIQLLHLGFLATARSIYNSAFTFSFFSKPWVLLGMGLTVGSQLLIVYVPFLQTVFRTAAFPAEWWLIIGLGLFPGFLAVELGKWNRRRFTTPRSQPALAAT